MFFQIGDRVVHRAFGPGEIIRVEEKKLAGQARLYYVVVVSKLTLWVPVDGADERSLRPVLMGKEFQKLYSILRGPGEDLCDDRYERQTQLLLRMREGTLEGVCRVVRDLTARSYSGKKMNDNDTTVLQRAVELLMDEWQLSQNTSRDIAQHELESLLDEGRAAAKLLTV
jgi:RNA polymerase-interacting CarD/CdnL/TRCF family regulator